MSNLELMRTFEIVSDILFVLILIWIIRSRNPLSLGAYLGATTVYGFDWMWCTKGFFNTTFNADLIPLPGLHDMGIIEPYSIPLNYGIGFGVIAIWLVRAAPWLDRRFGIGGYLAVWLFGAAAIAAYEIPVVYLLHAWTYHQAPEYLFYGFPWSNFWLAGNLVLGCYTGLRCAERWAEIPIRAGFSLSRETTWKGLAMGAVPIWAAFYATQLIQMFWYSAVTPWVESGRPF
jgi:hypothetical protein